MLKLVGRIQVEFDVNGFAEAGEHETTLKSYFEAIQKRYPNAKLEVTQRRQRAPLGLKRAPPDAIPIDRYRKG